MNKRVLLKPANWIFNNSFPLYKFLYFNFKLSQDAENLNLIKSFVKSGDVLLDIGANIGFYTIELSKMVGESGRVHSFEPDKKNYSYLQSTTKKLTNVALNNKAVADKDGTTVLYTSDALNVEHTTYKPVHFADTFEIEQTSILINFTGNFD